MTTKTRGWPPSRRREQAERIRRMKPWLKSTGPRSVEGKAQSCRNAYKHGFRSGAYREICRLLRWQRDFVKHVQERCRKKTGPLVFELCPLPDMAYKGFL